MTIQMATRSKMNVTLKASASGVSHSRTDVAIRDLCFSIDEPTERGGTNTGPTPTDTALAALIGCTNVIGHKCAARMELDIGQLDIEAACEFDRRGVTQAEEVEVPFISVNLTVTCSGTVSNADLRRLSAEVERFCPLSKLFRNAGTKLIVSWKNQ